MSQNDRSDDDHAEVPFSSDAERAEFEWLVAREHHPDAPAPSEKVASEYAQLEALLGSIPEPAADDAGWQGEILRQVKPAPRAPRPRWRQAVIGGGGALAVAAVALFILIPHPAPSTKLSFQQGTGTRSVASDHVIGDRVTSDALPSDPSEIRVYRPDDTLAAVCPGGPGCRVTADGQHVDFVFDMPGRYHIILVVGTTGLPREGTRDAYIQRARAAQARIEATVLDVL